MNNYDEPGDDRPTCRSCLFCSDTGEVHLCQITDEIVNPDNIACATYQEDLTDD